MNLGEVDCEDVNRIELAEVMLKGGSCIDMCQRVC